VTVHELDCLGRRCPLPVIALARRITEIPIGDAIRVLADDPAAATDIPAWCRMRGHTHEPDPAPDTYVVRRLH
jgi:tRNA 2-thiouridine synthesizing protein A